MVGRRRWGAIAVVLGALALPTVADAAAKRFTVTGKLTGSDPSIAVLLVANDGSSVRTNPDSSGKFTVKVPTKIAKSFVVQRTGKGATLHVLKNGEYAGPVVLGKATKTKGYTRLTSKKSGTVSVGTVAMKTGYAIGKASRAVVDTASTVRMKNDAPVGSQGLLDQMLMGPVASFGTLTNDAAAVGADADRDGLPNFADGDVNGDGLLDAAQAATATEFTGLDDARTLVNRPSYKMTFQKILQNTPASGPINSNENPSLTQEQLRAYLATGMSIEMAIGVDAGSMASTTIKVDCRKLSYCSAGSLSKIIGAPGSAIDGKSLVDIQDAEGLLTIPQREGENRYQLRFKPGMASAADTNLVGDVFEILTYANGVLTSSEVRQVTSSVVTPMGWDTVMGAPVKYPIDSIRGVPLAPTASQFGAFTISFFRPQTLASGSTFALKDRGGLKYKVALLTTGSGTTSYPCAMDNISGLSGTLAKAAPTVPRPDQALFDTETEPAANGARLAVTLDLEGCFKNGSQGAARPAPGTVLSLEIESSDSDSNISRSNIYVKVP